MCLAAKVKLHSDDKADEMAVSADVLLSYPNAKLVVLFLSNTHIATFFDAVGKFPQTIQFTWLTGNFAMVYFHFGYLDLLRKSYSKPVPNLQTFIESISPWNDPNNDWLWELWESAYKCNLSDKANATGNACV